MDEAAARVATGHGPQAGRGRARPRHASALRQAVAQGWGLLARVLERSPQRALAANKAAPRAGS
eukprot:4138485-Pyramimonas_sp.AAC.1